MKHYVYYVYLSISHTPQYMTYLIKWDESIGYGHQVGSKDRKRERQQKHGEDGMLKYGDEKSQELKYVPTKEEIPVANIVRYPFHDQKIPKDDNVFKCPEP